MVKYFGLILVLLSLFSVTVNAVEKSSAQSCQKLGPVPDPSFSLREEAGKGCLENVKLLLAFPKVDINAFGNDRKSALMLAAMNRKADVVGLLTSQPNIDVNILDYEKRSAIHLAVAAKSLESLRFLAAHPKTYLSNLDKEGFSPLSRAAQLAFVEGARLLASLSTLDKNAGDPLHEAAKTNLEIVKILVAAGLNINSDSRSRGTPLTIASWNRQSTIVAYLLSLPGIDVNRAGTFDNSPLIAAVAVKDNLPIVRMLLARPEIDVNYIPIPDSPNSAIEVSLSSDFAYTRLLMAMPNIQTDLALQTLWDRYFSKDNAGKEKLRELLRDLIAHPNSHPMEVGRYYPNYLMYRELVQGVEPELLVALVNRPSFTQNNFDELMKYFAGSSLQTFDILKASKFFNPNLVVDGSPLIVSAAAGVYRYNSDRTLGLFTALLSQPGINVNAANVQGTSALMALIQPASLPQALQLLLDRPDTDINLKTQQGTALSKALCKWKKDPMFTAEQIAISKKLLQDPRLRLAGTAPLLSCALKTELREVIYILSKLGPHDDLNVSGPERMTALGWAVKNGFQEIAAELLKKPNLEVNKIQDWEGNTALHFAIEKGDLELVKMLLAHPQIDVNAGKESVITVAKDRNILLLLLRRSDIQASLKKAGPAVLIDAIKGGDQEVFDAIHAKGVFDLNTSEALHAAAASGAVSMIDKLLGLGANANFPSKEYGESPLFAAAKAGQLETLERLIREPAVNLDFKNAKGNQVLLETILFGQTATAKRLLQLPNIDVNAPGRQYLDLPSASPAGIATSNLFAAATGGMTEVVHELLRFPNIEVNFVTKTESGFELSILNTAIYQRKLEAAQELLRHPLARADHIQFGKTSLQMLLQMNENPSIELVQAILVRGVDVNRTSPKAAVIEAILKGRQDIALLIVATPGFALNQLYDSGRTLLHYVVASGAMPALLENLVRNPAVNVNAVSNFGETPLTTAAANQDVRAVSLFAARADLLPNATSYNGKTALIYGAMNGQIEIVKTMLNLPGTDRNIKDNAGYTALMWAVKNGHQEIVNLLR